MGLRATALLSILGVGLVLAVLLATHEWGFGWHPDGAPHYRFLLEDVSDRYVYQMRGRWLPSGRTPYLQEESEYPQLATWLFAAPYLFFTSAGPVGRAQTAREFNEARADSARYFDLHHVSMAISLLALLLLTALGLRELGHAPGWALLLFLPGTVYFSFNRFDAWPASFVALALLLQFRGRRLGAAAALALGAMMKWYPILLLPLFLSHNLHGRPERADAGGEAPRPGPQRSLLARLPGAVLLPGVVAALLCVAILGVTYCWDHGGMAAVTWVYKKQGFRPPNPPSLVWALAGPGRWGWVPEAAMDRLTGALQWLQFLPGFALALLPVRSRRSLLWGSLVVVLAFAQFGKVFSPQWVVWVAPIAVLLAPVSTASLLFNVVLQVLIYVQIPVLWYATMRSGPADLEPGAGAGAFWAVCDARIVLLFLFWAWSLGAFLRTVLRGRQPESAP